MSALSVELRTIAKGNRLSSLSVPVLEEAADRLERDEAVLAAIREGLLNLRSEREAMWQSATDDGDKRHFVGALQVINNVLFLLDAAPKEMP